MARIPESEIERLKTEIALERLVSSAGIELRKHGADLIGRCPFHDDREPSLVISPNKNLWHCLGACQTGGSVIDWVIKTRGVSFRHAVELLKEEHPSLAAPLEKIVRKDTTSKLDAPIQADVDDQAVLSQVVEYYHETLKQSPEALRYLEARGLTHPEMISHFRIGFANRTIGYRLPEKNRKAGAELRGRLQRLGIIRESGHEHFNGSIVIPVFDLEGNVLGMYGRKITPGLREGTPLHLYLPGPHKGVWNEEALLASKEIILCESLIDALTFWCAGFRNVTASYGVGGFTEDHKAAFKKHGVKQVWIAYDRDEAGDAAAERLKEELAGMGIGCHRVLFPRGSDANEYAQKVTPASQSLAVVLNAAHFWTLPGVRQGSVASGEWSDKRHDSELPRLESLAKSDGTNAGRIPAAQEAAERRELRVSQSDPQSCRVDSSEYSGGPGAAAHAGVSTASFDCTGQPGGSGHAVTGSREAGLLEDGRTGDDPEQHGRITHDAAWLNQAAGKQALTTGHSPLTTAADEIMIDQGDRRYRARGLAKNLSPELLKVNLLVSCGGLFHVDTLDLNLSRQRAAFTKQASEELQIKEETLRRDLGQVWMQLEKLRDEQIRQALTPGKQQPRMSEEERAEALALLHDPKLLERIVEDFERCGLVGEKNNKLIGYLAAVSRHLDTPLAVVVQSSSAAGKSSLMDAVLAFVPEEERIQYSAMTGQSLYYMGEMDLKHKVLAVTEEEGVRGAAYALKLLQSEGELTIASTGKDPATGKLVTHQYRVEGPVMMFLTTTAIDIDEELLNRCLVLAVNEDREQTQAIHRLQREQQTLQGLLRKKKREALMRLHQNAQRLLKPVYVVNPYVHELTFPDRLTRMRRDHMKFLTLIRAIAFLHQHQRPIKTESGISYIEATPEDIETAKELMDELMRRSLDELPPQTRKLLTLIEQMVNGREGFFFSRRDVRAYTGWGATQTRIHMDRLHELEYLVAHRGGRGQTFLYEYDGNLAGSERQLAGAKRGQNAGLSAPARSNGMPVHTGANGVFTHNRENGIYREA
ncbi:MAG: toprim domain-containing protein [Acidobacteriaceae bacterium]|nr:toprim domain-containing protein [Acidobacteriaceae bacterium]